ARRESTRPSGPVLQNTPAAADGCGVDRVADVASTDLRPSANAEACQATRSDRAPPEPHWPTSDRNPKALSRRPPGPARGASRKAADSTVAPAADEPLRRRPRPPG